MSSLATPCSCTLWVPLQSCLARFTIILTECVSNPAKFALSYLLIDVYLTSHFPQLFIRYHEDMVAQGHIFLVLPYHLFLVLPSTRFPSGLQTTILHIALITLMCTTCPAHLTVIGFIFVIFGEDYKLWSFSLCKFLYPLVLSYLLSYILS
jgi:hypothetical protein